LNRPGGGPGAERRLGAPAAPRPCRAQQAQQPGARGAGGLGQSPLSAPCRGRSREVSDSSGWSEPGSPRREPPGRRGTSESAPEREGPPRRLGTWARFFRSTLERDAGACVVMLDRRPINVNDGWPIIEKTLGELTMGANAIPHLKHGARRNDPSTGETWRAPRHYGPFRATRSPQLPVLPPFIPSIARTGARLVSLTLGLRKLPRRPRQGVQLIRGASARLLDHSPPSCPGSPRGTPRRPPGRPSPFAPSAPRRPVHAPSAARPPLPLDPPSRPPAPPPPQRGSTPSSRPTRRRSARRTRSTRRCGATPTR